MGDGPSSARPGIATAFGDFDIMAPPVSKLMALLLGPLTWYHEAKAGAIMNPATISTTLRRHPERTVPDEVGDILMSGIVAHIGIVEDGLPVVIPMTYAYDAATPGVLYIHGSTDARILAGAERGAPACVTVTVISGLVYSKTALNHSMIYRSVVGFGRMTEVTDEQSKADVL